MHQDETQTLALVGKDSVSIVDCLKKLRRFFANEMRFRLRKQLIDQIIAAVRRDLMFGDSVQLIAYWGIGYSGHIGNAEIRAAAFLREWLDEFVDIIDIPAVLTFIITDTHAALNGIPRQTVDKYLQEVGPFLGSQFAQPLTMTEVLGNPAIARRLRPVTLGDWNDVPMGLQAELIRLAGSFSTDCEPLDLAQRYFAQNLLESAALSYLYPLALFLTYQAPPSDLLLPPLPKIHAYVDVGKTVKRPWFAGG